MSSLSHGSVVLDSTPTASAKVLCTLDQPRDQIMAKKLKILMTWDNGEPLPKKLITGPCAQLKTSVQIHGQIKRSNASASLSHNTSQVIVVTKEKTVSVTVGSCLESNKTQTIQLKMLILKTHLNNHLPLMTQIELLVFHALPRALRMPILFLRERNNASVTKRSFWLTSLVFLKLKTSGDPN